MISAVFDSVALLQAAMNENGPAGACLAFVDAGHVKLFISPETLEEIREVLHRPEIRTSVRKLTDEYVLDFIDRLVDKGHMIEGVPNVYQLGRDPKDTPFLNLAITTQVPFIVSRDHHLVDLMKDDAFRKAYPGLAIIDPVAFLKIVRAEIAKEAGSS